MWDRDNPLLYRRAACARRRTPWMRVLDWTAYPLLVSSPFWLFGPDRDPIRYNDGKVWLLALFLHFLYFAGRPLFETISTFASERQRRTLDCLLTTGFSVRRWCRTLFACAVLPRLLEAGLYAWILALFPGGEPHAILKILPLTGGCVLFYAAAGLWLSVHGRTQAQAQLKAILLLSTNLLLIVGVDVLITENLLGINHPVLSALTCPWLAVIFYWRGAIQICLLASLLHAGLAWVALRLTERHLSAAPAAPAPRPPSRSRALRWVENPLLYRSLVRPRRWLRLLVYPATLLSVRFGVPALTDTADPRGDVLGRPPSGVETALYLALLAHMLYVTVRALTAGSHAVAEERENRTWEPLLSTRLSLNRLLLGQFAVRLLPVLAECLLWGPLWLMFSQDLGGPLSEPNAVVLVSHSLSWIAFIGSLSLWQSSRSSSAGQALRNTAIFALVLAFGTIAFDGLTDRLSGFCSSWFSPTWALVQLTQFSGSPRECMVGFAGYMVLVPVLLLLYRRRLKLASS